MENFTPLTATIGGVLIGLSATILWAFNGRTAGVSNIFGAILPSHDQGEDEIERSHVLNLLGRKTDAQEIADAALFLAAGHLANGETLYVDSGQHLLNQQRDVIYLARESAAS